MTEKDMELFRDIQEQALQVKLNIRIGQSVCSWVRNRVNYIVGKAVAVYSSVWSDVVVHVHCWLRCSFQTHGNWFCFADKHIALTIQ